MTELKSCPFCGAEAEYYTLPDEKWGTVHHFVSCKHSCNEGLWLWSRGNTKQEAIEAWNRRANPWHTGKPTENGKYLVQYRTGFMEFLSYRDGKWLAKETAETMWGTRLKTKREDVTDLVVAWREIEPYKEASNGKVSD